MNRDLKPTAVAVNLIDICNRLIEAIKIDPQFTNEERERLIELTKIAKETTKKMVPDLYND